MRIIGWIRQGDQVACGGTVAEGDSVCTSHGRPYAFQGARIACQKNCIIAEGFSRSSINGRIRVIHGIKTSGGCAVLSTLNDLDGIGNENGEDAPIRFVQDDQGGWVGKTNEDYDQHFQLIDAQTGKPLANRYYRMNFDGNLREGKSDENGMTEKVTSDDPIDVSIEILPEGYAGVAK